MRTPITQNDEREEQEKNTSTARQIGQKLFRKFSGRLFFSRRAISSVRSENSGSPALFIRQLNNL